MRPVREGYVEAISRPLNVGRSVIAVDTEVVDADGRAVARVVQSQAIYHFLEVNGCDLKTFYAHERQVFDTWHERSRHKWTIDYGPYAHLVRPDGDGTLP